LYDLTKKTKVLADKIFIPESEDEHYPTVWPRILVKLFIVNSPDTNAQDFLNIQ